MNLLKACKTTLYLTISVFIASCSTTRVIPQDESRLKSNKVIVENANDINPSTLLPYLKQKPNSSIIFGINPLLSVYNWSDGKDNWWGRFVRKIGQAPVIFDRNLVTSSNNNLYNHLTYQGYYNSIVKDTIVTNNKKTKVTYFITAGKQYTIDSIKYNISDTSIRKIYLQDTSMSLIKAGAKLSENLLENESQRATKVIRDKGYFNFSKNYFFFHADTTNRNSSALLTVNINDYTRNENPKEAKPQVVYSFGDVYVNLSQRTSITSIAQNDSMPKTQYDSVYINNVVIVTPQGRALIRPRVLSRINLISPGTIYNEQIVQNTYLRYSAIQLFNSVNIQIDEADSNNVVTNIKLTPSALQGYKLSLEASSNSSELFGISPGISYYHKNLFRGGEVFNINFTGNFQFKPGSNVRSNEFGVSMSLNIPNFLLLNDRFFRGPVIPSTEVSALYNYQQRPEYTRNIISGSYGYSWNVRNRFFYKINPVQINIVKIFNISESFYESLKDPFLKNSYQNHFDIGMGTNFYYTTDASVPHTKSYFYLRWVNDISGNVISLFNRALSKNSEGDRLIWGSPYSQYFRTEVSAVYTWIFGKNSNRGLAVRFLAGIGKGYGNSISLPFEKLFWAGGAYGLRGWQARTVGPGYSQIDTAFTIPNQTGDMKLEANIEYRFPLFWLFDGAVFADAGNVWNIKQHDDIEDKSGLFKFGTFYKHIAADCGVGLRLNLGFTLLRLDMGLKTYNPATDKWTGPGRWFKKGNYGLQFGIDYPF